MSPLWTYNADHRKRPNVHPLTSPSGAVLSRDAPEDHPWHHGLWFTIKFVNEENFWEQYYAYGVLRHVGPTCRRTPYASYSSQKFSSLTNLIVNHSP